MLELDGETLIVRFYLYTHLLELTTMRFSLKKVLNFVRRLDVVLLVV